MSIFNVKQSFILYQTFGNIYTIAPFCKHALRVFHTIAWHILLAHAQANFPPVHIASIHVYAIQQITGLIRNTIQITVLKILYSACI
jgi:hypothetical protein